MSARTACSLSFVFMVATWVARPRTSSRFVTVAGQGFDVAGAERGYRCVSRAAAVYGSVSCCAGPTATGWRTLLRGDRCF